MRAIQISKLVGEEAFLRDRKSGRLDCGRTRTRFAHRNPIVPNLHEVINNPIYDDSSVAVNTAFPTQVLFFQVPTGQSGKTLLDTNMRLNGMLQAPYKYLIRAFRFLVRNDATITDLIALLYTNFVNFVINTKPYFQGPAVLWSAGAGAQAYSANVGTVPAGSATFTYSSNGVPDQRSVYALSRPINLEQGENFFLELNNSVAFTTQANTTNPPGTGLKFWAALDGELFRGVQ